MATCKWNTRPRRYEAEKKLHSLPREETASHPLKGITITVTEGKVRRTGGGKRSRSSSMSSEKSGNSSISFDPLSSAMEGLDPLSQLAAQVATDPLSQMAAQMSMSDKKGGDPSSSLSDLDDMFEPWTSKKSGILSRYTTSEKLSITTSFLSASDKEKVIVKSQTATVSDKVKNRLEQLEDFEEGSVQEILNLSQQDYVHRIEELNSALTLAWNQDQRVKALKIAIQCAKLLADVSVIQFYPSKFVLVTDILDTFGKLVYDRIKTKANYMPKGSSVAVQLPDDFTSDQVPESAKETCRNWFYKIASIRELVPRFYVETAILKCYCFLASSEYSSALRRLASMARGIGDPLVALYARCYLCRVGMAVVPDVRDHLMPCFDDFLITYCQIQGDSVQNILAMQKLELPKYLTLYSPGLDWILQCISHKASDRVLVEILSKSKKQCNSALLLNSIVSAFKPEYISARAIEFTQLIKECEDTGFPKHLLYRSLGTCLVLDDPPAEHRLTLLNEVWKVVIKLKNPVDYVDCAEVWIEYVCKHFTKREVNTILGDLIKHLTPDRAYEDFYPQLQSIVSKILVHMHDFSMLFSLEKFLPFIDMFQKDTVKVEVCKSIMEAYNRYQNEQTNDPVITSTLMFVCKIMHDSLNALSIDDEVRVIGQLIYGFIQSISFGKDFEQQLSFYVECRASFNNIDSVLTYLIHCVNGLAMETRKLMKGNHSRKTAAFVRACVAYCFITIPSLNNVFSQLNLYLLSGQVALLNQCLSQADGFFKAAISLIPEMPKSLELDGKVRSTEPFLLEYINNFIAVLLNVPDNPDQGVLYLQRGLLNVIQEYPWDPHLDTKASLYCSVLCMLSAATQDTYINPIDKIDSNDRLYGCDVKFLAEVSLLCGTIVDELLAHLKALDTAQTHKRQCHLALDLFNRLIAHTDLTDPEMFSLAVNLWALSQRYGQVDTKTMVRSLEYVKKKGTHSGGQAYAELGTQMPLQSRT